MFMQNEFEKQVQQKMEELKLVPSDPVWEKVEMQIRKKKDRRRVIFWIPLFALIGAGLWLGIDQYSNSQIAYNKKNNAIKQNSVEASDLYKKTNKANHPVEQDQQTTVNNKKREDQTKSEIIEKSGNDFNSNVVQKSFSKKTKSGKEISFVEKKTSSSGIEETFLTRNKTVNEVPQQQEKATASNADLKNIQSIDTATSTREKNNTNTVTEEPIKQDSTSIKKPEIKKHASSKWKYSLVAVAGTSGLGRINVYNGRKSLYVYNSPPAGASSGGGSQFNSYGPSEVEKSFAFAVGVAAKRQLGKRTFFSAGLQYNYYSNTIHVGTVVNQNRTIMNFAVSQFYSNQSSLGQPYKNQYHFISAPADIDWQLLKKQPLNLNFGLSFQYLLQTNALRFDNSTQSYFHDIAAFNRVQLFSGFGFTYSIPLKQKPLTFGPQLQYGLTRLEKGNSDHHLFSYGLKAQWQFKK
jgi:hypothetical protein